MLNNYFYFFLTHRYHIWLFIVISICVFPAYSIDKETLEILSLLKDEEYSSAVHLMEKEIDGIRDKNKKGYYALLLNQLPVNSLMKRTRYEYAFMAALWIKNIPKEERVSLWIEAGDGFFKLGNLKTADHCYKEALSYLNKGQSEVVYILHKRSWIYINQKKWIKAFNLLVQAMEQKGSQLRNIILFDIGKTWVESQYFKNQIPFGLLLRQLQSVSTNEQEFVINGIVHGINRIEKRSMEVIVSTLSGNQKLFTRILNYILSDRAEIVISPCRLLLWLEKSQIQEVKKKQALSVLNSCTRSLISLKKKNKSRETQFKRLADLYVRFERKGVERWPLTLVYSNIGWKKNACSESLRLLFEVVDFVNINTTSEEIEKAILEAFRFCKKAKGDSTLVVQVTNALFSSNVLIRRYKNIDGLWENVLFNLLNLKLFSSVVQKNILTAKVGWRGKDLLPALLLSHINIYQSRKIKDFLNRFSKEPADGYYLDILINREDVLTTKMLQQWLPISDIDSYRKILPWLKKALVGEVTFLHREAIVKKLLEYFPSKREDKKIASLFLALHYLKTDQIFGGIFNHWDKVSSIFNKENLAVELFEKSLYNKDVCESLGSSKILSEVKTGSLLWFTYQCCQIMESKANAKIVHNLKVPLLLRSSFLAWDFVLLVRIQKRTLWLEKGVSQLHSKTSKMIMDLKKAVSSYQKRKWRLEIVARKVDSLLKKQIGLFENELTKLARSSPYGEKYEELKNIVVQWR